jgi:hypothetical protein
LSRGWFSRPQDRPRREGALGRRWGLLFAAGLLLSLAAEFVLPIAHEGEDHWWYHVPFFWAIFGFAGCVILVVGAKWLGRKLLDRPEDYYAPDDPGRFDPTGREPDMGPAPDGSGD